MKTDEKHKSKSAKTKIYKIIHSTVTVLKMFESKNEEQKYKRGIIEPVWNGFKAGRGKSKKEEKEEEDALQKAISKQSKWNNN